MTTIVSRPMTEHNPAASQAPGLTLAQLIANELADGTIAVGNRLLVPVVTPTGARSLEVEAVSHIVYVFTSDDAAAAAAQRRDEDDLLDGTEVSYEPESETFVATCDDWRDCAPTVRRMARTLRRLLWGREAGRVGEHLVRALDVDERDRRDPERDLLTPDDFRAMATKAAHAGRQALGGVQ